MHSFSDVEPLLRERLPEFARYLDREYGAFDSEESPQDVAYTTLEHLRLWLLANRGGQPAAFAVIEELARDGDEDVLGALAVALLEGTWPRAHLEAMGPATLATRER
jgi:hypothetical protein